MPALWGEAHAVVGVVGVALATLPSLRGHAVAEHEVPFPDDDVLTMLLMAA